MRRSQRRGSESKRSRPTQPIVKSVARAVHILSFLFYSTEAKSLAEISAAVGLHKTTALRLLRTLESEGIVRRDDPNGRYEFNPVASLRAAPVIRQLASMASLSQEVLDELANRTGETVVVICPDETGRCAQATMWALSPRPLRLDPGAGRPRMFLHAVAAGKCCLAYLPRDELREWMKDGLPAVTPHTITSRKRLLAELADVRRQGYALNREEAITGVPGLAVPLRDATGAVIAGLSVAAVGGELTDDRIQQWVPLLRSAAELLSEFMYGGLTEYRGIGGDQTGSSPEPSSDIDPHSHPPDG
jgi:DNA-binding IclR family transcriptional regulator